MQNLKNNIKNRLAQALHNKFAISPRLLLCLFTQDFLGKDRMALYSFIHKALIQILARVFLSL